MDENMSDYEFQLIKKHLNENYGIYLHDEKKSLVYSRLNSVLTQLDIKNFSDYYRHLTNDTTGKAEKIFIDRLTTNHTFFMRETNHFEYFYEIILPQLEKKYKSEKDIRIWCAGCSSGEEAYTIQFLIHDYLGIDNDWDTNMFATDISYSSLSKASKGIYSNDELSELPKDWLRRYFEKVDDESMQVKDFIRNKMIFRRRNLIDIEYKYKKKMNIIFCRNVMIYFDVENRRKLIKRFYDNTADEGYIFIGHSESLSNLNEDYKYISPAIYQK